jgi:molybdenum cofactor sulfurtransferase
MVFGNRSDVDSVASCAMELARTSGSSLNSGHCPMWLAVILVLTFALVRFQSKRKINRYGEDKLSRKEAFLQRVGDSYGYGASTKGFIDTWRGTEFPGLVEPLVGSASTMRNRGQIVYLDYAGAALPAMSQLEAILGNTSVLANPHSTGPAASRTALLIEQATKRVISHFNCEPMRLSGLLNVPIDCDPKDLHPGYDVVFTSGSTEALRIVAERFPWTSCHECGNASTLVYGHNSHTSVVGMRGPVLASGARFQCRPIQEIGEGPDNNFCPADTNHCHCRHSNLLVVTAECNFGGERPNIKPIIRRCRETLGWSTMIDFSKAASTSVVDLKECDPDFACISFYKLFGEPTGLGVLFIRRSAISTLMRNDDRPRYFGGGSVDVVLPSIDFKVSRQQPSLLASLKNGTIHFRGIVSLVEGFNELESLGGMAAINQHARCVTAECVRRLRQLRHQNGKPVVTIYGAWAHDNEQEKGPTVAFNCVRSDGSFVGYNEVSKLAELQDPPLQLRTGCFCNPGACQEALGLKDEDVQNNYYTNGHVCGDHVDIIEGQPTGAVRVSFGKDSLWEDLDYLVSYVERTFVNVNMNEPRPTVKSQLGSVEAELKEVYIFPIKSCAAQRVKSWALENETGRLIFDREFALVDTSGTAMRLQKYPQMSQIKPRVDLESMTMTVSAPGCEDLIMSVRDDESCTKPNGVVQVCGNKCGGQLWGDFESSQWFSQFLGVQCWLARQVNQGTHISNQRASSAAFLNDEPILMISQNAVDRLNLVLTREGQGIVETKHFRPNFVVSVDNINSFTETNWKTIQHSRSALSFQSAGECARSYHGHEGNDTQSISGAQPTKRSHHLWNFSNPQDCGQQLGGYYCRGGFFDL